MQHVWLLKSIEMQKNQCSQLQVAAATDGARATCQKPDAIPGAAVCVCLCAYHRHRRAPIRVRMTDVPIGS